MKKTLAALVSFLSLSQVSWANYEACKTHIINKFNISKQDEGKVVDLCTLNSTFIQQCMDERSDLLRSTDFDELSEYCATLLNRTQKRDQNNLLQQFRVRDF